MKEGRSQFWECPFLIACGAWSCGGDHKPIKKKNPVCSLTGFKVLL